MWVKCFVCVIVFGSSWAQWGIVKQRALHVGAFEPKIWWRVLSFDVFFKGLSSLGCGGWSSLMRRPTLDQVSFFPSAFSLFSMSPLWIMLFISNGSGQRAAICNPASYSIIGHSQSHPSNQDYQKHSLHPSNFRPCLIDTYEELLFNCISYHGIKCSHLKHASMTKLVYLIWHKWCMN